VPPLVGAGQAIIPDALPSQEQARCACNALEIADGRLPVALPRRAGACVRGGPGGQT